ncbi:hypothetical protein ACFFX1_29475 [Dactylosporangium sucinum]|uniref:Lipoprotein n=1 Tax=Dactylosporangium sucinum TaxID=1424081 RepID=A0A917U600_9ACTN|nr:hypothetical protein [Dactylosporangium sucinum]GGM56393.1 hypothetical protein GCM10007977_067630 [Dactylosporangium sucinum]
MKPCRTLVIGSLVLAMASCTATPSIPTGTATTYTCCEAADIDRDYQPGQTLTVHWTVVPGTLTAGGPAHEVELNARLTGPYATVSDLKTASGNDLEGGSTFTADPVRPSGQAGEQPVSSILIPLTAAAGYYDLITSVSGPPGSYGGASIIRVIPKT